MGATNTLSHLSTTIAIMKTLSHLSDDLLRRILRNRFNTAELSRTAASAAWLWRHASGDDLWRSVAKTTMWTFINSRRTSWSQVVPTCPDPNCRRHYQCTPLPPNDAVDHHLCTQSSLDAVVPDLHGLNKPRRAAWLHLWLTKHTAERWVIYSRCRMAMLRTHQVCAWNQTVIRSIIEAHNGQIVDGEVITHGLHPSIRPHMLQSMDGADETGSCEDGRLYMRCPPSRRTITPTRKRKVSWHVKDVSQCAASSAGHGLEPNVAWALAVDEYRWDKRQRHRRCQDPIAMQDPTHHCAKQDVVASHIGSSSDTRSIFTVLTARETGR